MRRLEQKDSSSHHLDNIKILIQRHKSSKMPPEQLLTTESPHPLTTNLSKLAQTNLLEGFRVLQTVDQKALGQLLALEETINQLAQTFSETLHEGGAIKMGGCGSAARAATLAERIFRDAFPKYANQVYAINAGGDLVIVRAAEGFEDRPDYGRTQLMETGWNPADLYVGVSASGAAGFVSGQIECVLSKSHQRKPIFIICNKLSECVIRFADDPKTVFHNTKKSMLKNIDFLEACVGQMGLSGSTRMQAATAQTVILGFALLQAGQTLTGQPKLSYKDFILSLQTCLTQMPLQSLSKLTQFEASTYAAGNYIIYLADAAEALVVATDTTERSPTYNWAYFENDSEIKALNSFSRSRIIVRDHTDTKSALTAMLGRELRALNWDGLFEKPNEPQTNLAYLLGYDLTETIVSKRKHYMPNAKPNQIKIQVGNKNLQIQFENQAVMIPIQIDNLPVVLHSLYKQLVLKMVLNSHSTLVAGRMGCYTGNLMTSVRPSNEKLINRAIALTTQVLLASNYMQRQLPSFIKDQWTHDKTTKMLYKMMLTYRHGDSIVFNTRDAITTKCEMLCFAWIFDHIQVPSEIIRNRFFSATPEVKESVPLVSDIEVASAISRGKNNILCIEGGGTYFRFSILSPGHQYYSLQLNGIAGTALKAPGGNCNAIGWDNFINLVNGALDNIRIKDQSLATFIRTKNPIIVIGMAGMGVEANRQKLQAHLKEKTGAKPKHILITTDADTYLAALPSHGAVLIAGTGSICLGLNAQGERIQAGGLGAQLSADPGSAFGVGRQAVLDCLYLMNKAKIWDEAAQIFIGAEDPLYSPLLSKIEDILKIPRSQLVGFLNREHAERVKMAELAPIVFEYAFDKKPASLLALKIINGTAKDLALQLAGTMDAIFSKDAVLKKEPFNVILVGGIFESQYREKLLNRIEQQLAKMGLNIKINWEHEPSENYVSRVVQRVTVPTTAPMLELKF